MRGIVRVVIAYISLLVVPVAAYAQASITGVVRDTSGAVLPGVSRTTPVIDAWAYAATGMTRSDTHAMTTLTIPRINWPPGTLHYGLTAALAIAGGCREAHCSRAGGIQTIYGSRTVTRAYS